ncbi:MAG: hypothetical protein J6L01_03725 [Alistipes sp.]|nr:hypothetical protein [Alistipes sp.]
MSKTDICKALYALPGEVVVPRRKSFLKPVMIMLVGVLFFVVNTFIPGATEYINLKSAIVLFGAVLALVGLALIVLRMGEGGVAPYHTKDCCFLKEHVLKFDKHKNTQITELINKGDFETLMNLPKDDVSAITVVVYSSPKSEFCAAQAFDYFEFELHPMCEVKVRY